MAEIVIILLHSKMASGKKRFHLQRNKMLCLKLTIESFCLAGYLPGRLWVSEPQSWLLHISFCQTTALVLAGCWDTQHLDTTIESFACFLSVLTSDFFTWIFLKHLVDHLPVLWSDNLWLVHSIPCAKVKQKLLLYMCNSQWGNGMWTLRLGCVL